MKITRKEHLAQVIRINAILDLIENTTVRSDLTTTQLEYINDLENKLCILGEYTMDKCKILENATNVLLEKFTPATV